MPLHLVCGHRQPDAPVAFVTAYIPSEDEWETPIEGLSASREIQAAIKGGWIADWRDVHYSNYETLSDRSRSH